MEKIRKLSPSPAVLIALLALIVACSGTAYAASLAKNSVGSPQVKNNSLKGKDIKDGKLTGADVKNDSLTGSDINEGTLTGVDAAKVGGLSADAVNTRIASDFNTSDNPMEADGVTDVNTVTFTVPVRSTVKLEISGYFYGAGAGNCPCVIQSHARLSTEVAGSNSLIHGDNLSDFDDGFARGAYGGVRTIVLNPGTYTFHQTIVNQTGASPASRGSAYSRLVVTAYPYTGTGAAPAKPAPLSQGKPTGSAA